MELFILVGLFCIFVSLFFFINNGLGAITESWRASDPEQKMTFQYLAINQIEPVVNFFIVGFIGMFVAFSAIHRNTTPLPINVFATMPMIVLLVPFLGVIGVHNPTYRRICFLLGLNGLVRWLLAAIVLGITSLSFPAFMLLIVVLWATIAWGNELLKGPLNVSSTSQPPAASGPRHLSAGSPCHCRPGRGHGTGAAHHSAGSAPTARAR